VLPAIEPRPKPLAMVTPGEPRAVDRPLAGPAESENGVEWRPLKFVVGRRAPDQGGPLVAGLCWDATGGRGFAVTAAGTLWRFRYPEWEADRVAELGRPCDSLGLPAAGLVVALPEIEEVWVISPDTLAVARRIGVAELRSVHTAPGLSEAYAVVGPLTDPQRTGKTVVKLGLTDGTVRGMAIGYGAATALAGSLTTITQIGRLAVSPDGRSVFADTRVLTLVRFRVDGDRLIGADGMRESGGTIRYGICLSPDGRWVAHPPSERKDGEAPRAKVFRADDLSAPAFVLPGFDPQVIAFDPTGRRVLSHDGERPLRVLSETGAPISEHRFFSVEQAMTSRSESVHQILPHPSGRDALVRLTDRVLAIRFTR
jgi:hypothetical protein